MASPQDRNGERLPPHSVEAEQGVLGCLLLDPDRLASCHITPEQFYDLRHRVLFSQLQRMHRDRKPIDPSTVYLEISAQKLLNEVGGIEYLAGLPDTVPSAANLDHYAAIVTEKGRLRALIQECQSVISSALAQEHDTDTILGDAEIRLTSALAGPRTTDKASVGWHDLIDFNTDNDPNCLVGIRDGVTTRYLCRGYGAWLLGPSGIGKSSLMFQIGASWAIGRPLWGIAPTRALRVLVVQAENDTGDLAEQTKGINAGLGIEFTDAEDLIRKNLRIRSVRGKIGAAWCTWLRAQILEWRADLVLVDPLLSFAGIDVSRQDQCSQFLRLWLDPVLDETGAALLSVHHTGKPKGENGKGPQTIHEKMYAGLGSSELVNWARAVMLVEPAGGGAFRLALAKRGSRAGACHPSGEPATLLWLRHAQHGIFWEQTEPPEEKPYGPSKGHGRPSAIESILALNLKPFLATIPSEGESQKKLAKRLEDWLESTHGRTDSEPTCRRAIAMMMKAGKLQKDENGYRQGPNA